MVRVRAKDAESLRRAAMLLLVELADPSPTRRQMEVLTAIRDFRKAKGYSPTLQEIGDQLGICKVTVFGHVGALQAKGLIVRGGKGCSRTMQVSPVFVFPRNTGKETDRE